MKRLFIIITSLVIASGCEMYLDVVPKTQLSPENLYSNEKGLEYGVNEVYRALRDVTMINSWNHWLLTEVTTDNMLTHSNKEYRQNLDKYHFTASNDAIVEQWVGYYKVLGVANSFIINAGNSDVQNQVLKARVIAEARFIRAYCYFMMVRLWGDVPLVTEEVDSEDDFFIHRDPAEDVYTQIITDLEYSRDHLPGDYPADEDAGRVTSGAAGSLLSFVYLTRKNYELAEINARDVIDSEVYTLHNDYVSLFRPEGNTSSESVFQIQALTNYNNLNSLMGRAWSPRTNIYGLLGFDQYTASFALYNMFGDNDDRKQSFVIATNQSAGKELPYTTKYLDPDAESEKLMGCSFHVIRFAEVLLTYAEAENEINGPTEKAYDAINLIRNRAKLEDLIPGLNKDSFRDSLYKERQKELYFEGQRWFDLVRTNRLVEVVEAVPAGVNADFYPSVELPKHLLFPVPALEIEINPNLAPNNTGW
ncbi:MAG: RagB/SusD family nutrient uptake outer membrane protein [Bacteroidales bacterium]|nr:RagB/SusD family nutrient uptake outer membrane protein [Bacteroidales bacterium]